MTRTARFAVVAAVGLAAVASGCDGDANVIENEVVRPGITAMEQAPVVACDADRRTLDTALAAYEAFKGEPAANEQALIEAGFLRAELTTFDVLDGIVVPVDPACA